jgi:hypothetical protein
MQPNPYQSPRAPSEPTPPNALGNRPKASTAPAIALAIHVAATATFFIAKQVQWNARTEMMRPTFSAAGDIAVFAILTMFVSWIVLAGMIMIRGAVWKHWIIFAALACMLATGLFMASMLIRMTQFLYPG